MLLCSNDHVLFGSSKCRALDFTIAFENTFLAILPCALFILFGSIRLWQLAKLPILLPPLAKSSHAARMLVLAKVIAYVILVKASVTALSSGMKSPAVAEQTYIGPALLLSLVASILVAAVSSLEHFRTTRSSMILPIFLIVIIFCDATRIRTLQLCNTSGKYYAAIASGFIVHGCLFILENVQKGWIIKQQSDVPIPPELTAGFCSRLVFAWIVPLFRLGSRQTLSVDSLGAIPDVYESSKIYSVGQNEFLAAVWGGAKHPLLVTLLRSFPRALLSPLLPCFIASLSQIAKPYLIKRAIDFVGSQDSSTSPQEGYVLAAAFLAVGLIYSATSGLWSLGVTQCDLHIRAFLLEAIYRKATEVDVETAKEFGASKASNLMGVDTERLLKRVGDLYRLVNAMILIILGLVILWYQVGIASIASVLSVLFIFSAAPYFSGPMSALQARVSAAGDARLRLTASVLRQFRAVKLSGFDLPLAAKINALRDSEIAAFVAFGLQLTKIVVLSNYGRNLQALTTIGLFAVISLVDPSATPLTTARVFTALSVLGIISEPLNYLGQSYAEMVAAWASLKRIEEFLLAPEAPNLRDSEDSEEVSDNQEDITFTSASFGTASKKLLSSVTVTIPAHATTFVVGRVGSGKSVFLQACLGELSLLEGKQDASHTGAAYCSQDPWLPAETIRDTIVFLNTYESDWYQRVIHALALDTDLKSLSDGDRTLVTSLSGGQKQRVALARAVYSKIPRLVLDDSLSAVDASTEAHVFSSLFDSASGLLVGKTIILSTNNVDHFRFSDHIIMLADGSVVETGCFKDLMDLRKITYDLVQGFATGTKHKDATVFKGETKPEGAEVEEDKMTGDEGKRESLGWRPYGVYFSAVGYPTSLLFAFLIGFSGLLPIATLLYLQRWSTAMDENPRNNLGAYLAGYVGIQLFALVWFIVWFLYAEVVVSPAGSRGVHRSLVKGVFGAPLALIQEAGAGKILNRFSSDLHLLDQELPSALRNFAGNIVNVTTSMAVLIVSAPLMSVVVLAVLLAFSLVQMYYSPTSQQLRRLELGTRSPLYTLLTDTLDPDGLRTIRAFAGSSFFVGLNTSRTGRSQIPFYLLAVAQRWLKTNLDIFGAILNSALVFLAVYQRSSSSAGLFAVALLQGSSLSDNINRVFAAFVEMEICVVAAERIDEMASWPSEEGPQASVPLSWPPRGEIEFDRVSVSYGDETLALQDVSFHVKPGTRLGIVGRTGSGKSTLLAALFRMLDLQTGGTIFVDGLDLKTVPRHSTRAAMSLIPQDPMILDLSLRENLDLLGEHDDTTLWTALEKASMKSVVETLPNRLDENVGNQFSRGQRQLLALARALLEGRKILCLDEATSSLDVETDQATQLTLRSAFQNTTTIAIAHRISTIADFDQIIVLDGGKIVEQGSPEDLMKIPDGAYRRLAKGEESM